MTLPVTWCSSLTLLACLAGAGDSSSCTVVADCFLQIYGPCDGSTRAGLAETSPELCDTQVGHSCGELYLLRCASPGDEASWCYWCDDKHSDCFGRLLQLCAAGRRAGGEGTPACVSCSELRCCRGGTPEHNATSTVTVGVLTDGSSRSSSPDTQPNLDTGNTHLSRTNMTAFSTSGSHLEDLGTIWTTNGLTPSGTKEIPGTISPEGTQADAKANGNHVDAGNNTTAFSTSGSHLEDLGTIWTTKGLTPSGTKEIPGTISTEGTQADAKANGNHVDAGNNTTAFSTSGSHLGDLGTIWTTKGLTPSGTKEIPGTISPEGTQADAKANGNHVDAGNNTTAFSKSGSHLGDLGTTWTTRSLTPSGTKEIPGTISPEGTEADAKANGNHVDAGNNTTAFSTSGSHLGDLGTIWTTKGLTPSGTKEIPGTISPEGTQADAKANGNHVDAGNNTTAFSTSGSHLEDLGTIWTTNGLTPSGTKEIPGTISPEGTQADAKANGNHVDAGNNTTDISKSGSHLGDLGTTWTTRSLTPPGTKEIPGTVSSEGTKVGVNENGSQTTGYIPEDGKVSPFTERDVVSSAMGDAYASYHSTPVSDGTSRSSVTTFDVVNHDNCSASNCTRSGNMNNGVESESNETENVSSITDASTNTTTPHKTLEITTSNNAKIINATVHASAAGFPIEGLYSTEEMRETCKSPYCLDSDCYFQGHCYVVRKLEDSYVRGRTGVQRLGEVCDVIRTGAKGLAVEGPEEVLFVARLLQFLGVDGSVLTAGVRHCCRCNVSDTWLGWDEDVDGVTLQVAGGSCRAPAHYVISAGKRTAAELSWELVAASGEAPPPSHAACEARALPLGGGGTTRPPPPPPPPRPEHPARCFGHCRQRDLYGLEWTSPCGMYRRRRCPAGELGFAWWYCSHGAHFWGRQPNYGECHHRWIEQAKDMVAQNVPATDIVQMVQQLAVNESFFGHEIPDLLEVLNASCALHANQTGDQDAPGGGRLNESSAFTWRVASALGQLLHSDTSWLQLEPPERGQLGAQLLNLSDEVGFSLAAVASQEDPGGDYRAGHLVGHLLMEVQVTSPGEAVRFPSEPRAGGSHVVLSGEALSGVARPCSVGVIISGLPVDFLFPPAFGSPDGNSSGELTRVNSPVVSFSLHDASGGESAARLPAPGSALVVLVLQHSLEARGPDQPQIRRRLFDGESPTAVRGSAKCVYWNSSLGETGLWDDWGCRVLSSTDTHTTCACDHLSTFAVLMDVHEYVGKESTLQVLSLTCSAASVVCLLLTLVVFHGCKSIQSERTSIGKNLCVCLLVAHILTLSMLDRTFFNLPEALCSAVAACLHYFFLASFCWMCVEGHCLYRLVVRVFDSGRGPWRAYVLFGFGFPALAVSLTEVVAQLCGDRAYGRDELCWLSTPIYIWFFMGPVLVLTLMNATVVAMAMRAAVSAGMGQGKTKLRKVGVWLKGWFSLCSLLGVTWLFGIGFMDYYVTFEYVFVILNGCQLEATGLFQGVFIFLFRCLLNSQVRRSVLNEARQRATVKRFNASPAQRASWYITSRSAASLRHSHEDSVTTTADNAADLPPKYEEAAWTLEACNPRIQPQENSCSLPKSKET